MNEQNTPAERHTLTLAIGGEATAAERLIAELRHRRSAGSDALVAADGHLERYDIGDRISVTVEVVTRDHTLVDEFLGGRPALNISAVAATFGRDDVELAHYAAGRRTDGWSPRALVQTGSELRITGSPKAIARFADSTANVGSDGELRIWAYIERGRAIEADGTLVVRHLHPHFTHVKENVRRLSQRFQHLTFETYIVPLDDITPSQHGRFKGGAVVGDWKTLPANQSGGREHDAGRAPEASISGRLEISMKASGETLTIDELLLRAAKMEQFTLEHLPNPDDVVEAVRRDPERGIFENESLNVAHQVIHGCRATVRHLGKVVSIEWETDGSEMPAVGLITGAYPELQFDVTIRSDSRTTAYRVTEGRPVGSPVYVEGDIYEGRPALVRCVGQHGEDAAIFIADAERRLSATRGGTDPSDSRVRGALIWNLDFATIREVAALHGALEVRLRAPRPHEIEPFLAHRNMGNSR